MILRDVTLDSEFSTSIKPKKKKEKKQTSTKQNFKRKRGPEASWNDHNLLHCLVGIVSLKNILRKDKED